MAYYPLENALNSPQIETKGKKKKLNPRQFSLQVHARVHIYSKIIDFNATENIIHNELTRLAYLSFFFIIMQDYTSKNFQLLRGIFSRDDVSVHTAAPRPTTVPSREARDWAWFRSRKTLLVQLRMHNRSFAGREREI